MHEYMIKRINALSHGLKTGTIASKARAAPNPKQKSGSMDERWLVMLY
jgi:hypothetical protein